MVTPDQLKHFLTRDKAPQPIRVPIDHIQPHPNYPPTRLKDVAEIEESIRKEGFDDSYPLKVIPHPTRVGYYQLIDGHRRLEAMKNCVHGPDCPENLRPEVPVIVDDYSHKELDALTKEDHWKRYPIPESKLNFENPKFCPQCGTRLVTGDNFCPECGQRLK